MSFLALRPDYRACPLHLRNLLQALGATSLRTMDLRALLFSSDGSCTATLCQVMTDLGIQAEICSERLVAVQQIAREHYDAIIVDWDLEEEAILLLKSARQQKAQGLNLALVQDDAAIARAWQNGANSVIRKPIDVEQVRDTLATARDLILSRHTEKRDKETRLNAAQAQNESTQTDNIAATAAKSGFLSQSMSRSALEAEENVGKPDTSGELRWQAARGPASLEEKQESRAPDIQPVSKQRWDEVKSIFREGQNSDDPLPSPPEEKPSQDASGIFSSLLEEPEPARELGSTSAPRYLVFAVAACVVTAGALYVWAPGGSYVGRLSSAFRALSNKAKPKPALLETHAEAASATVSEKPAATPPAKAEDEFLDPGPIASTDVDPSKIQIIETKVIPKPGAQQQAPTVQPPPDSDQAKAVVQTDNGGEPVAAAEAAPASAPSGQETPPPATAPQPAPTVAPPAQSFVRTPETSPPAAEGRTGVIIPDSLRNTPAPSSASSVEPFSVPEETALSWILHRVDPGYPAEASQQKLQGPVVLQAWIAKDGTVRDLKLLKGYFVLGRVAIDSVRQWRFKPYTQNGRPIDFQTTITVNFRYPN